MDIVGLVKTAFAALASLFDWRAKEAANKPDKDKAETLQRSAEKLEAAQARNREALRELDRELREKPEKRDHLEEDW